MKGILTFILIAFGLVWLAWRIALGIMCVWIVKTDQLKGEIASNHK